MKKIIIILSIICSMGLMGCDVRVKQIPTTPTTAESNAETNDLVESIEAATSGREFDHDTKIEIFTFIQDQIDSLNETDASIEEKESAADKAWKEAEVKFNITESDIMLIMVDEELIREYYLEEYSNATLENNGFITYPSQDHVGVATTKTNLESYQKSLFGGSMFIDSLEQTGKIYYVPNGTKVRYIKVHVGDSEVELLEGDHKGEIGYVFTEQIKLK